MPQTVGSARVTHRAQGSAVAPGGAGHLAAEPGSTTAPATTAARRIKPRIATPHHVPGTCCWRHG